MIIQSRMNPQHKKQQRWMVAIALLYGSVLPCMLSFQKASAQESPDSALCPAEAEEAIAPILQEPAFRSARWGIRVETLATHDASAQVLVDQEGDRLFIPASNVKLLTTAAALDVLGRDFQIHTLVYREIAKSVSGTESAEGSEPDSDTGVDLRVVGRGDPTLTAADVSDVVRQLGDRGIRHIRTLTFDDHYFLPDAVNPTWEWGDVQAGYGAAASSFILNLNELRLVAYPSQVGEPVRVEWISEVNLDEWQIVNRTVTVPATESGYTWASRDLNRPVVYLDGQRPVGAPPDESAIAIADPTRHFADQLTSTLRTAGITVEQVAIAPQSTELDELAPLEEIARISSPSLAELLPPTNRDSENIYAEALLRHVGYAHQGAEVSPFFSPLDAGVEEITAQLTTLGIDPSGIRLADGSGLSRQNLVSPAAFVATLRAMARHPEAELYRESLAIAGISGTLRNRLRDTLLEGRLYAKTGGLTGVASVSGYLDPPNFEPLLVSIILNHSRQSGQTNRDAIDRILLELSRLQSCDEHLMQMR
ncbi:MAG: D-alanyl-D-alanine carboxypeptidase/D-alanyl-D-alanine-endopeptidase [Elainellaceae cyanobacterium]